MLKTIEFKTDKSGFTKSSYELSIVEGSQLSGHNFLNAVLSHTSFVKISFDQSCFKDADLTCAKFTKCNIKDAHFQGAMLQGAVFWECNLEHSNFENANLIGATFFNCKLNEATLKNARVDGIKIYPYTNKIVALISEALTDSPTQGEMIASLAEDSQTNVMADQEDLDYLRKKIEAENEIIVSLKKELDKAITSKARLKRMFDLTCSSIINYKVFKEKQTLDNFNKLVLPVEDISPPPQALEALEASQPMPSDE